MNRVVLLPEQVANQIAAGEVVERPASVVKELVENSLDAGASRIDVEIIAAGRALIRITDDGCGMSRDDALLCLERHATSKIASAADLARVRTLGFRGEAIPSIASISRFTLTTREHSDDIHAATQVVINGGRIVEVREAGAPPGTCIEVRSLFFNVPARRKFLRSDETERAHIQHWLTTAALAHPQVAFSLRMEGRSTWQLPALPAGDAPSLLSAIRERLRLLVGEGLPLVAIDARTELPPVRVPSARHDAPPEFSPPSEVRVWGWIGAPGHSRSTRDDQHLFVNRRPIDNRGLNAALLEGYHNALMKGRYPLACLFLELDPAEVDVNIHPAKREVKFHRERAIRQFVATAIRDALRGWHSTPSGGPAVSGAPLPAPAVPSPPPAPADESTAAPPPDLFAPAPEFKPAPAPPGGGRKLPDSDNSPAPPLPPGLPPASEPASAPAATRQGPSLPPAPAGVTTAPDAGSAAGMPSRAAAPVPLLAVPLRVVGVIHRLYVVLESDRGLVLLDQHAAHERVLYEQMLRRMESTEAAPSQRLLLPETIELPPRDSAFLRENLSTLVRLGVGISEFGERTFLLDALPPFVRSTNPRRFARELIDELRGAGGSVNSWRLGEALVAKTVCRHAVKANDPLSVPEIEALIEDLRRCEMPYTCPHGRPTLIEFSMRELERRFGRIQPA